jgi:hypothetical protein
MLNYHPFAESFGWFLFRAKRPPRGGLFICGIAMMKTILYIDGLKNSDPRAGDSSTPVWGAFGSRQKFPRLTSP